MAQGLGTQFLQVCQKNYEVFPEDDVIQTSLNFLSARKIKRRRMLVKNNNIAKNMNKYNYF